jgi:hypothetical protein
LSRSAILHSWKPDDELGDFLGLDHVVPIYQSFDIQAQNLAEPCNASHQYMEKALRLIHSDGYPHLDGDEARVTPHEFGEPPEHCYPIYIFSIGTGDNEREVYVGKFLGTGEQQSHPFPYVTIM